MWLSTLALLLILVGCTWSVVNEVVRNQHESWLYLNKYGYNPCSNSTRNVACSTDYSSMLRDFQKNHGLKMTGALDARTKHQMNLPRCGNSDVPSSTLDNFKWSRSSLTWSLRSYPRQISQARATAIVNEAFKAWSAHIPLQIKEVCSTCSADIVIDTGRYNHNCPDSFDGPGRTLAHAFFPEDGRIHFDADERWTEAFDDSGFNFYLIAVHEIGHALGLDHNNNRRSIMYPTYQLFSRGSMLPDYDRQSIQAIYGASRGGGGGGEIPTIPSNAKWMQNGMTIAGGPKHGGGLNQLNHPHGLAVDDDGTVFIADTRNNRIVAWKEGDKEGRVVAGGKGEGNRLDQLIHTTDVLIDRETDSLLISDWLNRRIMRWSLQNGTTHGEMMFDNISCWGLTMDNEGSLYVTDPVKHEVRRYQRGEKMTTGTLVAGGNGKGNGLNQLNAPRYVSVDHEHAVYVSDYGNNRVMKWVKGAKEGIVVAGGDLAQLKSPNGIVVDKKGTLYVADFANSRVVRYRKGENKGEIIVGGHGGGNGANQFGGPVGLSFDLHGRLYVVDYGNARVQRFSIA